MSRLLTWPKSQSVLFLALLMLAVVAGFEYTFQVIHQPMAPRTIVDLEYAATPVRLVEMTTAWGAAGNQAARTSLLIDFWFMPAYALAFAGFTLLAARAAPGIGRSIGLGLTLAPVVAALCDVVENLCLLSALDQLPTPAAGGLLLASGAATVKFGLLAVCLGYWVWCGIVRFPRR